MRRAVVPLLALLCVTYVALDAAWLFADEGVQTTDAAYHFSRIAAAREGLAAFDLGAGFDGQRYGGLWYLLAALVSLVTGLEPPRLLLGLALLLRPLLVVGVYRLGFELGRDGRREATGLLAAALTLLLPGLVNYGRVLVLDLPLAVAVTWGVAFALAALRAHLGSRPDLEGRARLGLLACTALALLVKLNGLAFLLGAWWVVLRPGLRRMWRGDRRRLLLLGAVGGGIGAVTSAVLLLGPRGEALRRTLVEALWPGTLLFGYLPEGSWREFPGDWWRASLDQVWEATYYTLLQTLTPPLALASLVAFLWFFGRRYGCEDRLGHPQRDLLFWWFIIPAVGVTLLLRGLYDERYVVPLLPMVAAVLAVGLADLPRKLAPVAAAGFLLAGALNHGFVHHDVWPTARPWACTWVDGWSRSARVDQTVWLCGAYPAYSFMDRPSAPTHLDLPLDALEETLAARSATVGRPLRAVFLDDLYEVFYRLFQRSLLADSPPLRHQDVLLVTDCWDEARMAAVFESKQEVDRQIRAADVVLMRYGAGPDGGIRGRRCDVFWSETAFFTLLDEEPLADGTVVRIYGRNP